MENYKLNALTPASFARSNQTSAFTAAFNFLNADVETKKKQHKFIKSLAKSIDGQVNNQLSGYYFLNSAYRWDKYLPLMKKAHSAVLSARDSLSDSLIDTDQETDGLKNTIENLQYAKDLMLQAKSPLADFIAKANLSVEDKKACQIELDYIDVLVGRTDSIINALSK